LQPCPAFRAAIPDEGNLVAIVPRIEVLFLRPPQGEPRRSSRYLDPLEFDCKQLTVERLRPGADDRYIWVYVKGLVINCRGFFSVQLSLNIYRESEPVSSWSTMTEEFEVTEAEFELPFPGESLFLSFTFHAG